MWIIFFYLQAEDGIRDLVRSRGLGDVYKRQHITRLVRDAVGYNEERGDSVNVVNSSFRSEPPVEPGELESIPIWEQPWVQDLAKILGGVIVLLVLALTVLRPLLKSVMEPLKAPMLLPVTAAAVDGRAAVQSANPALAYEQQVAAARGMVAQDPKRVAQVVKTWVAADE